MDLLSQHEAFLRAIFDNPEDDTARLVYADFLDENDLPIRAEILRVQCELARMDDDCDPARCAELTERSEWLSSVVVPWDEMRTGNGVTMSRGLWRESFADGVALTAEDTDDSRKFRDWVVRVNPAWYGETKLYVRPGPPLQSSHIHTVYKLPFAQQVTEWNLNGYLVEYQPPKVGEFVALEYIICRPGDMVVEPVITQSALDGLTRHRGARRIRTLDLRNNHLGSDAARLLVKSPYLENLKQLRLLEGNYLRGKVWQHVLERFGEDVVE